MRVLVVKADAVCALSCLWVDGGGGLPGNKQPYRYVRKCTPRGFSDRTLRAPGGEQEDPRGARFVPSRVSERSPTSAYDRLRVPWTGTLWVLWNGHGTSGSSLAEPAGRAAPQHYCTTLLDREGGLACLPFTRRRTPASALSFPGASPFRARGWESSILVNLAAREVLTGAVEPPWAGGFTLHTVGKGFILRPPLRSWQSVEEGTGNGFPPSPRPESRERKRTGASSLTRQVSEGRAAATSVSAARPARGRSQVLQCHLFERSSRPRGF